MAAGGSLWAMDSVTVNLQNAGREVTYKGALVVDGTTMTLSNETLSATGSNEIAVLVVNGGKLVLDHCTITKTGDGKSQGRQVGGPGGMQGPPPGGHGPGGPGHGGPGGPPPGNPPSGDFKPDGKGSPGGMPPGGFGGGPGGPGGDDSFNFYGTNSAVVAVGQGSTIEMVGCTVTTDAEYANAVFACDNAVITVTEGINIETSRGSSRGLYATCAGIVTATGAVNISTQGAHCAALATDRGGGTVTVGTPGTSDVSTLNTQGDGSPCIYSTGDITAYNATGTAQSAQTMVVEGKNRITIDDCSFTGNSPEHGGIMLYQSTSGDADEGTSVLSMTRSTIKNLSNSPMFLVTNTHSIVNMDNCTLLDSKGNEFTSEYPLVTCRNCNTQQRSWGREGSNGGQIEMNVTNQTLAGTLLANESESSITITGASGADLSQVVIANGKGTVSVK